MKVKQILVSPLYSSPILLADGRLLPSRGEHVCQWIEDNCVYGEGDWFGEPVELRDFQRRFIYRLYEFYPDSGRRRYKRALYGVGKGNGKTPLSSWIAAHELDCDECAPPSPRVIVGAASLKQANMVFGDLASTVRHGPLADRLDVYDLVIERKTPRVGLAERVAAEAGTNDGARATMFCADEIHEWCMSEDAPVSMADGRVISAKDVRSGDLVLSWDGSQLVSAPVSMAVSNGLKPIVEIESRRGRVLRTTGNHRYFAERVTGRDRNGCDLVQQEWVRADELRSSDRLLVALGWDLPGGDADDGYLLGALAGDGHLTGETLMFTNDDPSVLSAIRGLVARWGCDLTSSTDDWRHHRITRPPPRGPRNPLRTRLREVGMLGARAQDKSVPECVMSGGRAAWIGFLSGYLDTDGSVSGVAARQPAVRWVSSSRQLLESCQMMLAYLGLQSALVSRGKDNRKASYLESFELGVRGRSQCAKLASVLMPRGRKAELLDAMRGLAPAKLSSSATQRRMFDFDRIKEIRHLPAAPTIAIEVEGTHTHVTGGFVTHNTGRKARVYMIVDGAIAKRANAFTMATTTAGVNDPESLLRGLYDHGKKVAAGEVVDDEFLFEWYEAERLPDENLDKPDQWLAAVQAANPALGDFCSLENLRYRFRTLRRADFERYHLNRFVQSDEQWEVAVIWPKLSNPKISFSKDLPVESGIDVALRNDSSAVVAAQKQEFKGGIRVVVRAWMWENPYQKTDPRWGEWKHNRFEIHDQLRALYEEFPVWAREGPGPAFHYDPHFFATDADILEGEGLNMLQFDQTDARMVPASQSLFNAVIDGIIVHDGNPALDRHIANVKAAARERGWRISKISSSGKIDGAVATAIAVHNVLLAVDEDSGSDIHIF